ncbi:hypothetical protein [Streptomyces sp. TLI_171]|uniref:hypothetical protein n=1 Tax=Streptomyces sp. TLI_171 TaxID=1938859 RepID=UPI001C55894D|nr:hypothetical protein [Streptomyces sp. TLI_171]
MTNTQRRLRTAYHLDRPEDGLDGLVVREEEAPEPGPHEVLIRVRAASLNRRDLMILDGSTRSPPPRGSCR